jgi:chemotaxis protein methyltransferase CheR
MDLAEATGRDRFRAFIASRFGLAFDETKQTFLEEVLHRRTDALRQSPHTYLAALEVAPSPDELRVLAEELTIGETYFFRNSAQFQVFSETVLPERMRARESLEGGPGVVKPLRFLSAGCSSGEEPYSISMAVRAASPSRDYDVTIRAVDMNRMSLAKARLGQYSTWSLRETPEDVQKRWFRSEGRMLQLDDSIRDSVIFEERNLTSQQPDLWRPETYDAIFCRNVIMYLSPEATRALMARVQSALVVGGYLFLGHAETLRGLSLRFHLCHTHGTFYYQRCAPEEEVRRPHFRGGASAGADATRASRPERSAARPLSALVHDCDSWVDTIRRASERIESLTESASAASAPPAPAPPAWDLTSALDLLQRERFGEALDLMHGLPAESDADPEVLLLRGVLLSQNARFESAEAVCRRLLAGDELNAGAHYLLATCREGVGDRKGAVDQDQMAVYLDGSFAMPRLHLGLMARRAGELHIALHELSEALVLLEREEASRLLLFGGGFSRQALVDLCAAEVASCRGGGP